MEFTAPVLAAVLLVAYGLVVNRLDRWLISGPTAFAVAGVMLGPAVIGVFDVGLTTEAVRLLAEVTLVLVLFGDASRLDFARLRHQGALPVRMLLIGMPLAIGAGALVARLVFADIGWTLAALLGTLLAPTDAALGQAVVTNPRVPTRIRQALNVESGLNDGLAAPIFAVLLAAAVGEKSQSLPSLVAAHVGGGALVGLAVGGCTALAVRAADRAGWTAAEWERLIAIATALLAWALAGLVGGNGFIAAFVGGLTWAAPAGINAVALTAFLEGDGKLVSLLVWLVFGAMLAGPMLTELDWRVVVYAAASLTVVRMVPIAASVAGMGLRWETTSLLGWFGPRGLASIVFGLEAVDTLEGSARDIVLVAVSATVLASVFAHGISASPVVDWYARRLADQPEHAPEQMRVPHMRTRGM